jgi:hypothetical protein
LVGKRFNTVWRVIMQKQLSNNDDPTKLRPLAMLDLEGRSWVEIYLLYPLIPFFFEMFIRWLILWGKIHWWEIPNLSTMMITLSFFCFFIMEDLSRRTQLPTDPEQVLHYKRAIKRFGQYSILAAMFFALALFVEAIDKYDTKIKLLELVGRSLCLICFAYLMFVVTQTLCIHKRFGLSVQ